MKTQSPKQASQLSKIQQYAKWLSPSETYSINEKEEQKKDTKH